MSVQFRTLFRHFLFRMVDLELLSRKGDVSRLLGQFAAVLVLLGAAFAFSGLFMGSTSGLPVIVAQMITLSAEHFLIATTMLVVGLFAVLSWDSTFPNRRDVFVLAPLPVRASTLFLAKVAAVGAALALTVVALHGLAGIVWPIPLHMQSPDQPVPTLTYSAALPPVDASRIGAVLKRDLTEARTPGSGALAPGQSGGTVVGVLWHGVRQIFAYGTAKPDSIFEIVSISKTFTGLALAQMVVQQQADLGEPVRSLLFPASTARPPGAEISLLELATHHSGLPTWPDNVNMSDPDNPLADYHARDLLAALARHGLAHKPSVPFEYSNFGYSVLAEALARCAGISYPELVQRKITGPLGMRDTVVELSAEQQSRFIEGHDLRSRPVPGWDMDAMAGAGGIRSTAGDMLTYLDAELHPEKVASAGTLRDAIAMSHQLRADVAAGMRIGLAWMFSSENGTYWHNGGTGGYSSYAFFHPEGDYAAVVLVNQSQGLSGMLGEHIRQRLAGEPAISLNSVVVPARNGVFGYLTFFAAYWITMFAGGAFVFCFVLGLQGLAAQLLPRRWFLRASAFLQMAAFCGFVSVYMLQPIVVSPAAIMEAQGRGLLSWSPTFWFLGLFQQLIGSPALAPLAHRAWLGLAICAGLTATAYLLSYFRTLRQIVEEPDISPSVRGLRWLPRFGNPLATAVTQFSIRTLLRSRQHRMILAFYWGIAFAIVIFVTKSPEVQKQLRAGEDLWHEPNVAPLMASMLVLCAAIVGIRMVAAIPFDLRANWIFQVTPLPGGSQTLAAVRRAVYCLGFAPVWCALAAVFLWLWPWRPAAGHLAVLGLLGIALTEVLLATFYKIPFTCSYLPGRSNVNMAVVGFFVLLLFAMRGAEIELNALGSQERFAVMTAVLGVVAIGARWWTSAQANSTESGLRFEEEPAPVILALDLHRDGVPPA